MRLFHVVILVILAVTIAAPVGAKTWYIKDDGTGDAVDIWTAINDSTLAGDTILLAAGTFYEYDLDISSKPLVIRSESGPDVTTVDCQFGNYGFYVSDTLLTAGHYEISGLTITNANFLFGAIAVYTEVATVNIENNTLTNSLVGAQTHPTSGPHTIHNNRISGCSVGISPFGIGFASITNNEITANTDVGIRLYSENFLIDGNTITNNTNAGIDGTGDGITGTISDNIISDHTAGSGSGIVFSGPATNQTVTVVNNLIFDNDVGIQTSLTSPTNDTLLVTNNTIDSNGLAFFATSPANYLSFDKNIITSNGWVLLCLGGAGTIEYACNDMYGNTNGTNCGVDLGGNFSADPFFCDAATRDYGLTRYSPCLDGPCGLVGALGFGGCPDERPYILAADDVGNDQGGQLRLKWERSKYDDAGSGTPVLSYGIYRREDAFLMASEQHPPDAVDVDTGIHQVAGWDFLMSVPARADSAYQTIVPTLCDSTVASGDCWSVFFVSATTASPAVYWDSAPDSGYSVDNLDPTPPAFTVLYNAPGGNELTWSETEDPDAAYYNIYREEMPLVTINSVSEPVHSTTGTSWTDPIPEGWRYTYMMSTVDHSGNESEITTPSTATAITDHAGPTRYALRQNTPNPFNPSTLVRYDVPAPGGRVSINVYDANGRVVRTLVDRHVDAGSWSATWDGRDQAGQPVASGVYFIRLQAPGYNATRKAILLK